MTDDTANAPAIRSDFWNWSLDAYEKKGVSSLLLQLQDDAKLNVNLLLWCLWCAEEFEEIGAGALKLAFDQTGGWSEKLASSLRTVRRALKTPPKFTDADKAKALRKRVKKAELDAEEIEQLMLEALAIDRLTRLASIAPPRPGAEFATPDQSAASRRAEANLNHYAALAETRDQTPPIDRALLARLLSVVFDHAKTAPEAGNE